MRTFLLACLFFNVAFSQGVYLSRENGVSAGVLYGRYASDHRLGFTASYSFLGFLDATFTRNSVLAVENVSNHQYEYLAKIYVPKENRFFFSGGVGYQHQKARTELWNDFPLLFTRDGAFLEAGAHLVTGETKTRRLVASIMYRYSEPTEELRTPAFVTRETHQSRVLTFDLAVVYYPGMIGFIVGPRAIFEMDAGNAFWGVHVSTMLRH